MALDATQVQPGENSQLADTRLRKRRIKNGRDVWTALIPRPKSPDGKRRQHRFTFVGNKKEAEKALAAELVGIGEGSFIPPTRATFGQYLVDWLAGAQSRYTAHTWQRLESLIRVHLIPRLGAMPLQTMTASDLNKAYANWCEEGLSRRTVLQQHLWIHRILDQAFREGLVRQNVSKMADRPRYQRREMRFLTQDEVKRLMEAAAGTWYAPLFALALATGARRGELLALKWEDVDFSRAKLSIRRALESSRPYGGREKSTKSGKPRVVDLPASALELLRRHRLARALDRIEPGYIFPGPDGGPWDPNKISQHFRHFRYLAKLKGASFHSLRHTAATQMLALGVSPKVVQERLGHGSISITMDLYSHSTPSLQADAARRLDSTLAPLLLGIAHKRDN